ncbi:MAG: hypothetical protein UW46_C0001G0024 [Candidatus Yanofskybacteria bacterium GW2011_GWF1_44_227]|uniref:Type IV secretion system coupling protein TraD DNA-binding domain-containing protein n=1 Tax=Candidatus Yanofskybacteria bacterium GW2011_GWE2_40_11 TaxID=1619033 RepID=A0A0G0TSJ7_9BACT|nr:MAG: hypothetical protein UT69_C0012G0026 [Candidatus Yanofskybacteria bacterium GW2011_GWE1_40_10]KKR40837.1 MAG: hypothetical protein UT75_C0004G0048 [Candidatus Yanofskybacteria bacterium GW2011_GWE2_40_11]KKT15952.1 MAG: hypothetical protein UV97_C0001G0125 [Candidatus Yanofskybacteria bacterium GW2011_GWF2_43_596]KKT53534.1 MAG: hypothetical protein UW46_C0001G0024 [Candidatus Yanofskybacteria bacterium GW2011_GWF1_44_227]OGN36058.1 MAG: hypothetical protein A2207_03300 [Candidatus Yano
MAEHSDDKELVFLGETNFRNEKVKFGIKPLDRRRHMYVIGATGMGKSEMMKNMCIQDIEAGRGVCYIDPHGDAVLDLLNFVPQERIKDVVFFNPGDKEYPISFNVMEKVNYDDRGKIASGLLGVFKKIWVDAWSGRMEYILNNTILALLEYPDSTLLGINRMLSSKEYRKEIVANIKDPIVKSFWTDEFAKYADKFATEATAAIQNKVGQFASNNLIRNIIGQPKTKLDIRKIMDEGKILLVNASRGEIGEDASRLLGALLITKIQLAAMSRVDIPESERRDFYLYVDEFQHFATESFANILSEARKYHLSLIMGHQYITQMEEPVRDAVFGNVGTIATFRVGAEDAEFLERWFEPEFTAIDIGNLAKYTVYIKLMINGISSKAFSAATLPPFSKPDRVFVNEIVEASRGVYTRPRDQVEKETSEWMIAESGKPVGQDDVRQSQSIQREEPRRDDRGHSGQTGGYDKRDDRRDSRGGGGRGGDFRSPSQIKPVKQSVQSSQLNQPNRSQPPIQQSSRPPEASLSALQSSPVDFKGRKIDPRKGDHNQEKKEVNVEELRDLLKGLGKKE